MEFAVRAEVLIRHTHPPISRSTFHELVHKNRVVPVDYLRGYYFLNASLRLLGLKPVRELPREPGSRSLEDMVRLAFSLIDRAIFPELSWLLAVEAVDARDADHARRLADRHRDVVEGYDQVELKLAYFQGVLDWVSMEESGSDASDMAPKVPG